jgi:hypothetical protein
MKYRLKLFLPLELAALGLLALTAGTWFPQGSARAQSAVMRLDPASKTVDVGSGDFTVDVVVDGVTNLGAYEFHVSFDPNVIRFVGVENGPFLGSTGRTLLCPAPNLEYDEAGDAPNKLRFGCGTGAPGSDLAMPGPDGSGVIATITFAATAAGTSPLTFLADYTSVSPVLVNGGSAEADTVALEARSGTVTVVGAGPTATARPDEPTSVPARQYVPLVHATATPAGESLFAPEPGEPQLTRPMPGSALASGSADGIAAGGSAGASGSGRSSAGSSAGGSPRAGSGPPEDGAARWPTFAGGLLAAAGAGLLAFSIFLKHGLRRRDDTLGR